MKVTTLLMFFFLDQRNPKERYKRQSVGKKIGKTNFRQWLHLSQFSKYRSICLIEDSSKKTSKTATSTPTLSSSSSSSSSSNSSSSSSSAMSLVDDQSCSKYYSPDYGRRTFAVDDNTNDDITICGDIYELDSTPDKKSARQLLMSGDVSENYVIDRISTGNKGYCSLLVTGPTPMEMEFNLDETCSAEKLFHSLPGTHKWMLYKDIQKGAIFISRGIFMSVTAIMSDMRVICCVETLGHLDVMSDKAPQLYKLHRDYFRMPEISYSSPISI